MNFLEVLQAISFIVMIWYVLWQLFNQFIQNSYWKRRGIKGAFVVPFFGNFITIFTPQPLNQLANSVKYGKVTGLFRGTSPMLMITDPKLIQRVLVKDFNYFRNRSPVPSRNQFVKDNFFSLRDEKWKRVRSIVSPTFSSHKLRKMSSIIDGCVRSIIKAVDRELVQKQEKSTIAIEKIFHNFGMDVIARCAFATETNALNDQSNEDIFVINARKLFEFDILGLVLSIILPEFIQDIFVKLRLPHFYQESNEFFRKIATKLIANRQANPNEKHDDLLQLMINARLRDNDNDNEEGKKEEVSDSSSINRLSDNFQLNLGKEEMELERKLFKKVSGTKYLSDDEILAQSVLFFQVGYDTAAKTLKHLFYELTLNEKIQERLYREIDDAFRSKPDSIDYDIVVDLPYLNAIISETLRKYPSALIMGREAADDYRVDEYNLTIEKGTGIIISIYAIHHNPEYYPEPERFDSERFMPGNLEKIIPYTYLPFGGGPRNCIGMRFVMTEMKLCVARLIHTFRFVRTSRTSDRLKILNDLLFLNTSPVYIGAERRSRT
ncbi:hypothetical protein NH340_JMT08172 [Sarcoptes scabiei]|nr:hypothetical protein NH340_JMT08172 [Sarcoptes scabiei]